jgi:hypothetical protein
VIAPRLQQLYEWSAHELAAPGLLDCIRDGALTYAWADRSVWQPPKSFIVQLTRRALPPARLNDAPERRSIVAQSREITLGFPVPAHSLHGVLPPVLHFSQGGLMRLVTPGHDFVQMPVLSLDDLVSGVSRVREIARSTQLLTGHGFHRVSFPLNIGKPIPALPK